MPTRWMVKRFGLAEEEGLLETEEVSEAEPKDGEVVVQVYCADLRFTDNLVMQNKYQTKAFPPYVPGHSCSGVVKRLGPGDPEKNLMGLQVGDPVYVERVQRPPPQGYGKENGAYQEELVVSARQCQKLKNRDVGFLAPLGLMYSYGTTLFALRDRAKLQPGETLLVMGAAGGLGVAAIQLGVLLGAKVIAAASSAERLEFCRQQGAEFVLNYETEDIRKRIEEITKKEGVDVVYDNMGGRHTESIVRSLAWEGRYLGVGFTAGEGIPKIPMNLLMLKGCAAIGVMYDQRRWHRTGQGSFNPDLDTLLDWLKEGKLKVPILHEYPLREVKQALVDLRERKFLGRAAVVTDAYLKARARGEIGPERVSSKL